LIASIVAAKSCAFGAFAPAMTTLSGPPSASTSTERFTPFLARSVGFGPLIAHGPASEEMFRSSAVYVDKILKGANLGDLPVGRPEKFDPVINLTTAQALGLTIPQTVLAEATELIEYRVDSLQGSSPRRLPRAGHVLIMGVI
jgi:hypothetical protein